MSEDREKKTITAVLSLLSFIFLLRKATARRTAVEEAQKLNITTTTMMSIEDIASVSESDIISFTESINVNSTVTIYLMGV